MNTLLLRKSVKEQVLVPVCLLSVFVSGVWAPRLLSQAQEALPAPYERPTVSGRTAGVMTPQPVQPSYGQWSPQTSMQGYSPSNSPLSAGGYTYPSTTTYNPWGTQSTGYGGMPYSYGNQQPPAWQGYLVKDPMTGSVMNYYSDGRGGIAHWSSLSPLSVDLGKVVTRSALNDYGPPPTSASSFGATNPWAQSYHPPVSIQPLVSNTYNYRSDIYRQPPSYQPISPKQNPRLSASQPEGANLASSVVTTGSILRQAGTLTSTGREYLSSGQIQKALESFNQALTLSQVAGNNVAQAIILSGVAHIFLSMGEARPALEHFDRAYRASQAASDLTLQVSSLRGKAAAYYTLGDSGQALESFRRARLLLKGTNDEASAAEIHVSMGWIYQSLGELKKALEQYQEALLLSSSGNRESEIRTRIGIGLLYTSLGEPEKAWEQYSKAVPVAQTKDQAAEVLSSAGELFQSVGMTVEASECFDRAISLMKETGNQSGQAGALAGLARTHSSSGWLGRGLYYSNEALRLMREAGNRLGEAAAQAGVGDVYYWAALSAYPDLRPVPISQEGDSSPFDRTRKASVWAQLKYLKLALTHYEEALGIMRQMDNRAGEFGILTSMGLVYDLRNEPKHALEYYHRAIEVLEGMRTTASLEEFKAGMLQQSIYVYRRALSLHIRLGQHQEAFEVSERARARTLLDQLGNTRIGARSGPDTELTSEEQKIRQDLIALVRRLWQERAKPAPEYKSEMVQTMETRLSVRRREYEDLLIRLKVSNPEYASLVSVGTLTLPQAQKLLNEDVTLVSYFVTPENTIAFVITRNSFHTEILPVSEKQLAAAIAGFRDFPQLEQSDQTSLKQLYKWLIAPIKGRLHTPLLGIVPHGVLHYLPFAALTDGKGYLGDGYTIFHLPSVSVLPFIKQKPTGGGEKLLAMAYGRGEGLPFLRYADREAQAVAGIYHTQAFLGDSASKEAFRAIAGEYNILHLAAHYQPNPTNPLFSHLNLAPGEADEGALEVRDIYGLDLTKTDLIVLSACQSQLGAQSRGDDIIGLERAFMYAGTTTLVASLWSVDDQATSELMTSFFAHLKEGMTKAAALRLAQAETRARHPHPYYWAGFVLTGHPG